MMAFVGASLPVSGGAQSVARGSMRGALCMVEESKAGAYDDADAVSRRAALRAALRAAGLSSAALAVALAAPGSARADRDLMTAKRSYFRYGVRAELGIDWYVAELYPKIDAQNWSAVLDAYEPKSDARDNSKKAEYGIDRKISDMQRYLFDPLTIWSQSFAEKGTGPTQRFLSAQEKTLEEQMDRLRRVAKGDKLDFSKENSGLTREAAAVDAWTKGRDAINQYVTRANANLSRELRRLDTIPDDLSTYRTHGDRPKAYGTFQ